MALLLWLFTAVWTVVIVRTMAYRSTLSMRSAGAVACAGAAAGLFAVSLAELAVFPFNGWLVFWVGDSWMSTLALAAMAVPLARIVRQAPAAGLSSADLGLLGFAFGFGLDVAGWLAAAARPAPGLSLSWLPPWLTTFDGYNGRASVTYAYTFGIVALAYAVVWRRWQVRVPALSAAAFLLVLLALDPVARIAPTMSVILAAWLGVAGDGARVAWAFLAGLLVATWWEQREDTRLTSRVADLPGPTGEWKRLLTALDRREWRRAALALSSRRLLRRVTVSAAAVLRRRATSAELSSAIALARQAQLAVDLPMTSWRLVLAGWWRANYLAAMLAAAFIVFAIAAPAWAPALADVFWKSPLLQWHAEGSVLTLTGLVCAGYIVWRYLTLPVGQDALASSDAIVESAAGRQLGTIGLLVVLFALLFGGWSATDGFRLPALVATELPMPAIENPRRLTTLLWLITVLLSVGFRRQPDDAWRAQPVERPRLQVIARAVEVAVVGIAVWAGALAWFYAHSWLDAPDITRWFDANTERASAPYRNMLAWLGVSAVMAVMFAAGRRLASRLWERLSA